MSKVLTIRDPKTGKLIAEELLQPKEDRNAALARVYRKALGLDAPEQVVLSSSIWLDDKEWAADLSRDWGAFGLALIGPKSDPSLEKARLVLAAVSDAKSVSRMEFPMRKSKLEEVKQGRLSNAVVPVGPEDPPAVGDRVTFREQRTDPFGEPFVVSNGDSVSVDLTEVKNQRQRWGNQDIYYIAWDPAQVKHKPVGVASRRSK